MNRVEITTAQGHGHWYHDYEVELVTVEVTITARAGQLSQSRDWFELRYRLPGEVRWDARSFDSAAARADFIRRSFSSIETAPLRNDSVYHRVVPHPLSRCFGERISRVVLRDDGLELDLGTGILLMLVWPRVYHTQSKTRRFDAGYNDIICSLLGSSLIAADEYLDDGLILEFANAAMLQLPMTSELLTAAEREGAWIEADGIAEYFPKDTIRENGYAWFVDEWRNP